jgi:hypothetical protein
MVGLRLRRLPSRTPASLAAQVFHLGSPWGTDLQVWARGTLLPQARSRVAFLLGLAQVRTPFKPRSTSRVCPNRLTTAKTRQLAVSRNDSTPLISDNVAFCINANPSNQLAIRVDPSPPNDKPASSDAASTTALANTANSATLRICIFRIIVLRNLSPRKEPVDVNHVSRHITILVVSWSGNNQNTCAPVAASRWAWGRPRVCNI